MALCLVCGAQLAYRHWKHWLKGYWTSNTTQLSCCPLDKTWHHHGTNKVLIVCYHLLWAQLFCHNMTNCHCFAELWHSPKVFHFHMGDVYVLLKVMHNCITVNCLTELKWFVAISFATYTANVLIINQVNLFIFQCILCLFSLRNWFFSLFYQCKLECL